MFKLLNCLICDDVRQEKSGKAILIGVYGPDLNVTTPTPPNSAIPLNLWVELQTEFKGSVGFEIRGLIVSSTKEAQKGVAFEGGGEAINDAPSHIHQITMQFPCRIDFTHSVQLEIREKGGDWIPTKSLNINAFPIVMPQPSSQ